MVLIVGVLFAALAFFVVGRAGIVRSNAQGAADAAALAAAGEARDSVFLDLDLLTLTPAEWKDVLAGNRFGVNKACARAVDFAPLNDASAECTSALPRFTVDVETKGTVGDSVIPGTGDMKGTATATAIIEARCRLTAAPLPSPKPTPSSDPTPTPTSSVVVPSKPDFVKFECTGGDPVTLDPAKPGSLNKLARSLFTVRLVN
jgi:hypothetical protein